MQKKEIIFVYRSWNRFQETTVRMLSERYIVKTHQFKGLRSILYLLKHLRRDNLSIYYFAGRHAMIGNFIGILKRHKTLVIVGGYEVEKREEIGYGALINPFGRLVSRFGIEFATYVIVVSNYLHRKLIEFTSRDKIFLCNAPNTVDVSIFNPTSAKKKNLVLSVGIISEISCKRKGWDTFVEVAKKLPEIKFVWAGLVKKPEDKKFLENYTLPDNLEIRENLSLKELLELYSCASVYCQLSYLEGFGVALAEAMACECVPVVTNNGALPDVVGDAGVFVPWNDVDKTVEGIKYALAHSELGKKARLRILENFSFERGKKELLAIMEKITN